jgi:hypothetical protein
VGRRSAGTLVLSRPPCGGRDCDPCHHAPMWPWPAQYPARAFGSIASSCARQGAFVTIRGGAPCSYRHTATAALSTGICCLGLATLTRARLPGWVGSVRERSTDVDTHRLWSGCDSA